MNQATEINKSGIEGIAPLGFKDPDGYQICFHWPVK